MSDTLDYRGYKGTVEYSAEDRVFYGKIHGIRDSVSFEGEGIDELEADFHAAIDAFTVSIPPCLCPPPFRSRTHTT